MRSIGRSCATALAFAVVTAGLLLPGVAAAQNRTGTVEITPFGGGYFGGTLHRGSNSIFTDDVDVETDVAYGLRIGVNLNNWMGLEAGYSRSEADVEDRDDGLFGDGRKLGELTSQHFELNFLFNFARRRVVPYVTLGAGATHFEIDVPAGSDDDTRFTSNLGFGVKVFVTPNFGLRFDGRGRAAYIDDRDCDRDFRDHCYDSRYRDDDERWYVSGEVTGGLTFAF